MVSPQIFTQTYTLWKSIVEIAIQIKLKWNPAVVVQRLPNKYPHVKFTPKNRHAAVTSSCFSSGYGSHYLLFFSPSSCLATKPDACQREKKTKNPEAKFPKLSHICQTKGTIATLYTRLNTTSLYTNSPWPSRFVFWLCLSVQCKKRLEGCKKFAQLYTR